MIDRLAFHRCVADTQPNICQITVIQNGRTVIRDLWNGYRAEDTVHTMSVTKSVVSLLVGIAIDQGLIGGVDDYVLDYFPGYRIKRGEKTFSETMRLPPKTPFPRQSKPIFAISPENRQMN